MKKLINRSLLLVLSLMIISCSSKKNVNTTIVKTDDGTTETYATLRIIEADELSDDGLKIIKKPIIVILGEGAPVDKKTTAVKSAQSRAANNMSNAIRQRLISRFNQKVAVIGAKSATVIRDEINALAQNISINLKPGEVIINEKDGIYQVRAEMYIPGDLYVKALKKAAKDTKGKIIAEEEIENTQKVLKAVDEIFDGSVNDLN